MVQRYDFDSSGPVRIADGKADRGRYAAPRLRTARLATEYKKAIRQSTELADPSLSTQLFADSRNSSFAAAEGFLRCMYGVVAQHEIMRMRYG